MHPLNLPRRGYTIATQKGTRILSFGKYKINCILPICLVPNCQEVLYLITNQPDQKLDQHDCGIVWAVPVSKMMALAPGELYDNSWTFQVNVKNLYPV